MFYASVIAKTHRLYPYIAFHMFIFSMPHPLLPCLRCCCSLVKQTKGAPKKRGRNQSIAWFRYVVIWCSKEVCGANAVTYVVHLAVEIGDNHPPPPAPLPNSVHI